MNATKERWLKAIEECMEQESYGSTKVCSLCKLAGYFGDPNCDPEPRCSNCVCADYLGDSNVPDSYIEDDYPCATYLHYYMLSFDDSDIVRTRLRQIHLWLSEKKETA